jgi:hypothetical protein
MDRVTKQRPMAAAALMAAAIVAVPMFLAGRPLAAQTPSTTPAPPPADQTLQKAGHSRHRTEAAPQQTAPVAIPAPPVPEAPKWPVNEKADPAAVVWDSHGLRIDAANSSLHQIMNDVSTATGAKVEGLGTDERVFGSYGPGRARDVLSQLLEGSSYNVLMIGDQGQGTPRQIVLSARTAAGPQTANSNNPTPTDEDNEEVQPQPQQPEPVPTRANLPNRTPQQMEMQREQMRLMQQGQQPAQQPPQPNP